MQPYSPTPSVTAYKLSFTSTGAVDLTSVVGPLDGDVDDDGFACWTVSGTRFAYIFNSVMCIWDFEQNQFVRWGAGAVSDEAQEVSPILLDIALTQ